MYLDDETPKDLEKVFGKGRHPIASILRNAVLYEIGMAKKKVWFVFYKEAPDGR